MSAPIPRPAKNPMPTRDAYLDTLDHLAALLRRYPMTAKQIATRYDCCKPIAYARIRALKQRGEKLLKTKVRESATGPKSVAYSIK